MLRIQVCKRNGDNLVKFKIQTMEEGIRLTQLSGKELSEVSGGGPLFRMFCLYVYINRETIWENTVGQYIEGFRDGYSSVVNQ